MPVIRASSRNTLIAPETNFTGKVMQDPIIAGSAPSRMRATVVSFSPGARTAWHTHPVGQALYCTYGVGRLQFKGEQVQELHPGDSVWIPPDVIHWHGAAPDRLFAHIAMSENAEDGSGAVWLDKVSDADYAAPPAAIS